MKIHEFQAKELFKLYSIPVPQGGVAYTPQDAEKLAVDIGALPLVVKAQIHAGGRGKGGGVKIGASIDDIKSLAEKMIGMQLITHQTGPEGREVKKVLIEQVLDIESEMYLSIIPDRTTAAVLVMASKSGGMDIETVAARTPEQIVRVFVDPLLGLQPYHCRRVAYGLKLESVIAAQYSALLNSLYRLFMEYDCSLVEINPLVITRDKKLIALDAKISFDENALFRHKDIQAYRDVDEEDPLEVEASKYHLNYIKMNGNVGNMVNGAGLAMATMDIIKHHGGNPANFLDVGGGATKEMVANAFRILLADAGVKAVLINIFGGIMRCDVVAEGVVASAKEIGVEVPLVVRLEGTNVERGREILNNSGLAIQVAESMDDAARKVVAAAGGN